jgi:hypothetical protein
MKTSNKHVKFWQLARILPSTRTVAHIQALLAHPGSISTDGEAAYTSHENLSNTFLDIPLEKSPI